MPPSADSATYGGYFPRSNTQLSFKRMTIPSCPYERSIRVDSPKCPEQGGEERRGSEHAMNSAKHADTLKYFKSLSSSLSKYDEILIFGPGKLQEQFRNFLNEDAQFKHTKISLDTAEHLTDPQMIARVREYFK